MMFVLKKDEQTCPIISHITENPHIIFLSFHTIIINLNKNDFPFLYMPKKSTVYIVCR